MVLIRTHILPELILIFQLIMLSFYHTQLVSLNANTAEFESSPQLLLSAPYLVRYLNHEIIVPEGSFLYYEQMDSISSKQKRFG